MTEFELSRRLDEVTKLFQKGQLTEALSKAEQTSQLARLHLGEKHPCFIGSLSHIGYIHFLMRDYQQAELFYNQALEIARRVHGENHPDFAGILNQLALLYKFQDDYQRAEPLYLQALEIHRKTLGEKHPQFGVSLNNLGALYYAMDDYLLAERFYVQALENFRQTLGEKYPGFDTCLECCGIASHRLGKFQQAEGFYREIMEKKRREFGEKHPEFATWLGNFGSLYCDMSEYQKSESFYRQSMAAWRGIRRAGDPDFAQYLTDFADLYVAMGDYQQAETLHRQASEMVRQVQGKKHRDFAITLSNVGLLYHSTGEYERAEPLYRQAKDVYRQVSGERHTDVAQSITNLASLYRAMGKHQQAEPLYRQAMELYRLKLGDNAPDVAESLLNIASIDHATGKYQQGELLFDQATEIMRQTLGEEHPRLAQVFNDHAALLAASNEPYDACDLMLQAAKIDDRILAQIFHTGLDHQRSKYIHQSWTHLEKLLSLAIRHLPDSPDIAKQAWDIVIRRKAMSIDAIAIQRGTVLSRLHPQTESVFMNLQAVQHENARVSWNPPGSKDVGGHEPRRKMLEYLKEVLEQKLIREIPEMGLQLKLGQANRQTVNMALPAGMALIEFVRFHEFDFTSNSSKERPQWKPARYVAFVVRQANLDNVQLIDLGEAAPIDDLITLYRASLADLTSQKTSPDAMIRNRVFDPLVKALGDRNQVLLAPDGMLTLLPFGLLPGRNRQFLGEEFEFHYVGCSRDVLRWGKPKSPSNAALVVADPDFDAQTNSANSHPNDRKPESLWRRSLFLDKQGKDFHPLPTTRVEGERIGHRLDVNPLMGGDALEGRLKQDCQSPGLLHLATHGFFLSDPNTEFYYSINYGDEPKRRLENPLLRSGLILTGHNAWRKSKVEPTPQAEDGMLTALDITGLDLLGTELVVLSACETNSGEGAFNLRRAFTIAGAKTIVVSLWRIPHLATCLLMDRFYEYLTAQKLPRNTSLQKAQNDLRNLTISDIREEWLNDDMIQRLSGGVPQDQQWHQNLAIRPDSDQPFNHPFYWGSFICEGDPDPLHSYPPAQKTLRLPTISDLTSKLRSLADLLKKSQKRS